MKQQKPKPRNRFAFQLQTAHKPEEDEIFVRSCFPYKLFLALRLGASVAKNSLVACRRDAGAPRTICVHHTTDGTHPG